jgi:ATP-dependent protease HslVU (ClpYQ) peptidase subunit
MTTIVGIQNEDGCEIHADSRVTDDNGRIYLHPDMTKFAKRGSYIIAGSGEVLPCDVAQNIWNPPKPTALDKKNLYRFMIKTVMPSLRKCLSENGYNFDEEHNKKVDGERFHLLIAVCGEIFDVDFELSVTRDESGIYAIGSGNELALGALHAGAEPLEALEIAAKLSAYTSGPFHSITQGRD